MTTHQQVVSVLLATYGAVSAMIAALSVHQYSREFPKSPVPPQAIGLFIFLFWLPMSIVMLIKDVQKALKP